MTEEDIKKMWDIDHKAQLGDEITAEEREFFKANYKSMLEEMEYNYNYWKYLSGSL